MTLRPQLEMLSYGCRFPRLNWLHVGVQRRLCTVRTFPRHAPFFLECFVGEHLPTLFFPVLSDSRWYAGGCSLPGWRTGNKTGNPVAGQSVPACVWALSKHTLEFVPWIPNGEPAEWVFFHVTAAENTAQQGRWLIPISCDHVACFHLLHLSMRAFL